MSSPPPKVVIGVITNGRSDSSLQSCVSILQLQMILMTTPPSEAFQADLRFYNTNNEALEDLYRSKDVEALFAIHWSSGIPGKFALKALKSKMEVVIGVHPDGVIDWDRVRTNIENTKESLEYSGINYNVELKGTQPDSNQYAKVKSIKMLDSFFIRRTALASIAIRHPEIISKDKQHGSFALDGVYQGEYLTGPQRFMRLYGKDVYADVEHQMTKLAPQDFTGIVGARSRLR